MVEEQRIIKKRRRRVVELDEFGNKKPKLKYFHAGTQAAIVAYQKETDQNKRNEIYTKEIAPAFEKLAENLINIHKFAASHDSFDDLKNDAVNFLFETIMKFDDTRGTNAFSYFNVVCKNLLIIKTKQKILRARRSVSLDDTMSLTNDENKMIEDFNVVDSQESALDRSETITQMINLLYDIRAKAKSENELSCINSIITIFENVNDIDILTKGSIQIYLRELSGLSPKQLTTAMQAIKKMFKKLKIDNKLKLW